MTDDELMEMAENRLRSDGPDALIKSLATRLRELHEANRWWPIKEFSGPPGKYLAIINQNEIVEVVFKEGKFKHWRTGDWDPMEVHPTYLRTIDFPTTPQKEGKR